MADDADSKSVGGNTVWVQVPPPAPARRKRHIACDDFFCKKSSCAHSAAPRFPAKLCCANFCGGPGRPVGRQRTALHSKSPAERLGFSHTAPSFLLLPAKLCFANFRRGPGRPAGRQTCKLCIACGDFFVKVTGALILLLLASPPCRAATHCAPFEKPGRLAGLSLSFSFRSSTPLAARAFPGENAHGSTVLLAHLCRHSQLRGAAFV